MLSKLGVESHGGSRFQGRRRREEVIGAGDGRRWEETEETNEGGCVVLEACINV